MMGRKPNQLILRYFSRGSKLDDASNRYEHTCKACGEHFPKGRIEALISHLSKKCPSLSYAQKQEIVIQFYDLSETALQPTKNGNKVEKSKPISLPFSPSKQNFNSLNILAEASRRVGENDPPKNGIYATFGNQPGHNLPLDPSLDIDTFTHTYLNDDDNLTTDANAAVSAAMASSFEYLPVDPTSTVLGNSEPVNSQGPELSSIAASASDMLPMGPDLDLPNDADGLFTPSRHILVGDHEETQNGESQISEHVKTANRVESAELSTGLNATFRPLAMSKEAHFVSESGTSSKSPKPKVRGKFSPGRRQEVREMRQRGACLRCRMLKKTCSNGNPCQACAAIESPRIWKNPCIRTKLVSEFDLYFIGLQNTVTYREITHLKELATIRESGGNLDIYQLNEKPTGVSLKAMRVIRTTPITEAAHLTEITTSENTRSTESFIVGSDNDDVSKKMSLYLRNEKEDFLEKEENPFVKTTLTTAKALARVKNDPLLESILLLWICTLLLVDDRLQWQGIVSVDTTETPIEYETIQSKTLPSKVSSHSNKLINAQLRVGIESYSKTLAKSILADLERRLLQKQRDRQFDTFLAVILLLNCFERICWLFKGLYIKQPDKWPFPQGPEESISQGERFADIIDLLVDMRSLPPRTILDPIKHTLVPIGNRDDSVKGWFDEVSVTKEYLQFIKERPFNEHDFHSMDGRFFARLLESSGEKKAPESSSAAREDETT